MGNGLRYQNDAGAAMERLLFLHLYQLIARSREYMTHLVACSNNIIATGGWFPGVPGIEKPVPPPDTYLIIDPVNELINTTARDLFMR